MFDYCSINCLWLVLLFLSISETLYVERLLNVLLVFSLLRVAYPSQKQFQYNPSFFAPFDM
jgi:hypothetical protein